MKLLIATRNEGKASEIRDLFKAISGDGPLPAR